MPLQQKICYQILLWFGEGFKVDSIWKIQIILK